MKPILPTTPCDECLANPEASVETPVGRVVFCAHQSAVVIFDKVADCCVTFSPVTVKAAGQLVAHAIHDRFGSKKPANELPA